MPSENKLSNAAMQLAWAAALVHCRQAPQSLQIRSKGDSAAHNDDEVVAGEEANDPQEPG